MQQRVQYFCFASKSPVGSVECCKILIEEFGALPDLVDANGNTPASYALEEGHEALYEYLLSLDVPNDHYVTEVSNGSRERR
jgi:ankyrin repeat protein